MNTKSHIICLHILVWLFLLIPISAKAQVEEKPLFQKAPTILKTNPLAYLWGPIPFTGEWRLAYETSVGRNQGLQLALSYLSASQLLDINTILRSDTNTSVPLIRTSGFRFQLSYKFYLSANELAPEGVYIAPHLSYSTAKFTVKSSPSDFVRFRYSNAALLFGYQFIINDQFAIDVFNGYGYRDNTAEYGLPTSTQFEREPLDKGLKVYLGFNVGVAF